MKLYTFFRSGTSHRLRIALNLKGLSCEQVAVDLRREEHLAEAYKAVNPQQLLPALAVDGAVMTQSPAIIEWLEERFPEPPLLPQGMAERAQVRALAAIVGCDIHPVNNRRILEALRSRFGADQRAVDDWAATWITAGFTALNDMLASCGRTGPYAWGEQPGLVDVYLIPQIESARRFHVDIGQWPLLARIDAACAQLESFRAAAPSAQADAG